MSQEVENGDSELLQRLKNYTIEPSTNVKRKMDYYFSPYNMKYNAVKYMKFDETAEAYENCGLEQKDMGPDSQR